MLERLFSEGLTLIKGPPGSGKTALAASVANRYKNSAWFTFYENRNRLIKFLTSMGIEPPRHIFDLISTSSHKELVEIILKKIAEIKPDFVVIDGLNALTNEGEREVVHSLMYHFVSALMPTVLIKEGEEVGPADYIADNIIVLSYRASKTGQLMRYLTVVKSRGQPLHLNTYTFLLDEGGPKIITPPQEAREAPEERLTTGDPVVDRELNGGVIAGSYVVVVGPEDGLASKLMVLTASMLARAGKKVLYHHHKLIPTFAKFAESLGAKVKHPNLTWYYHPVGEHASITWWYKAAELVNRLNIDVHFADQYEQVVTVAGDEILLEASQVYQSRLERRVTTVLIVNSHDVWKRISLTLGGIPDYVFMFERDALIAHTPEHIEPLKFKFQLDPSERRVAFRRVA
ncbi:ATPase domain-containing protein [Thermoproteus tenax]|uniref:RecA-superfamily ATPase n=1 Tax=Thermoproteus tenax (strain ATCC 35583 / DSM 2078 / JCM 9277 / NBRC 100435 / Kra 1) TaxID=768679 RepID=G4RJH1_THETK|nr:ATPase domain-containing protein [Thermoproteus tenax]CCC81716.1 RecA-superfamily ATPase [Thermoproteus tenax Kra 1]